MKVLVFNKKDIEGYVAPEYREGVWWIADCVATEVEIPDGCALAVVGPSGGTACPVCNGTGHIVAEKSMYFNGGAPTECLCCQGTGRWGAGYRRVVQEVM